MVGRKADKKTPIIVTEGGQVQGLYQEKGQVAVFKGIPFAAPPVGELRWRPPEPVVPWSGVLEATRFSPLAYQRGAEAELLVNTLIDGHGWGFLRREGLKLLLKIAPKPKMSEDCLYLNVRTPSLAETANLPVMVWIHGGDHQDGSGGDVLYDSNVLPKQGVVVVSINYRLGLMGYFAHPELSAESPQQVSGNYGTLDQIAALQWVRDNIAAFGGDPNNVTIFGESAGGESVAHMLTSPLARGLFHKAILQSPANAGQMYHLKRPFLTRPPLEEVGLGFAEKAGVTDSNQLAQLRQLAADELYETVRAERVLGSFYPVIDGYVLPQSPFTAFHEGQQTAVPIMVGSNADEFTILYPMTPAPLMEYVAETIPDGQLPDFMHDEFPDDLERLLALYPGLERREAQAEIDLLGDSLFGSKARFYADRHAATGQAAYLYMFTRTPPSSKQTIGACHAAELPFVHGASTPILPLAKGDQSLAGQMVRYWTQFAKTGDPNSSGSPHWDSFAAAAPEWMVLGNDDIGMKAIDREEKYEILNGRTLRQIEAMQEMQVLA